MRARRVEAFELHVDVYVWERGGKNPREEEEDDEAGEGEESLEPELIGREDAESAADSDVSSEESED